MSLKQEPALGDTQVWRGPQIPDPQGLGCVGVWVPPALTVQGSGVGVGGWWSTPAHGHTPCNTTTRCSASFLFSSLLLSSLELSDAQVFEP